MPNKETKSTESTAKNRIATFYNAIFFTKEIGGVPSKRARIMLTGRVAQAINSATRSVSYTSTRTFGWVFLSFGLLSLFLHLAEYYFSSAPADELSQLIIGAAFAIIAIPLVLVDMPMCTAMQRFPITDYILFEFFSIKRMPENEKVKTIRPIFGVFVGFIPAIFGFFFPMETVVLVIVGIIFVTISFVSPEFPFLFMLLTLPYHTAYEYSEYVLVTLSLLSLVSFLRKVMLGKRFYFVGISDVFVLLFAAIIVATGVIGGGSESTSDALMLAALTFTYIPAANIIVNRRLAECCVSSVIVSACPVALIAIAEYIANLANGNRVPSDSVMTSPYILAAFLTVATVLTAFSVKDMRHSVKKGFYSALIPLYLLAIITTECLPVLIVLLVSIGAYIIISHYNLPNELLIILFALPGVVLLLPATILDKLSSVSTMKLTFGEMRSEFIRAFNVFTENFFIGVGADGTSDLNTSLVFNAPLGIACRFGFFAILTLALIFIIRLRQGTLYHRFLKDSPLLSLSDMTTLGIFALLTLGWFCDIFADLGLYCLFFSLFGMCTAALRLSKREYDDQVGYFGDQKSVDASTVDVTINR